MITIWIGDFRSRAIHAFSNNSNIRRNDDLFFIEDSAEFSWLSNIAAMQVGSVITEHTAVVLLLGINDCINSCVWKNFSLQDAINSYMQTINRLVTTYSNASFYICSANPVQDDYAYSNYKDGIIPASLLNEKIEAFNAGIKAACAAEFIDSYNYFLTTGFNTRDGIRYTQDTSIDLYNYIKSIIDPNYLSNFIPRLTAPAKTDGEEEALFWVNESNGGYNPYEGASGSATGYVLPNNAGYVWGRFMEILEITPALAVVPADQFFTSASDGYERGQEPLLGAIACWSGNNGGYVAVVEEIFKDGSITTSESTSTEIFLTTHRYSGIDNNWGATEGYTFQGFIYVPASTGKAINVDKSQVVSKNKSLTKAEMEINAKYIWSYLSAKGWSLNAVAGILGNMQHESTINPGRREIGGSGFGLVQWTPPSNLTNWCDSQTPQLKHDDIDSQLEKIIYEKDNGKQYYKNYYKYNFKEFSVSQDDPYTLACAFAFDYERSAVVIWGFHSLKDKNDYIKEYGEIAANRKAEENREALRRKRGTAAEEWYNFLLPFSTGEAKPRFDITSLKLGTITPTSIVGSFITNKECKGTCKILNMDNTEAATRSLDIKPNRAEVVAFKINELIPNTDYKLLLELTDSSDGNKLTRTLFFTTQQALPESPKSISLKVDSEYPYSKFNLEVLPENIDFGYWENTTKNTCGYMLQLIINGRLIREKVVNSVPKSFDMATYFKYESKLTDTIQVGVRTLVEDSNNNEVFDSSTVKTSNTICGIVKPVTAYIKNN